jgi:arylsulfatase A
MNFNNPGLAKKNPSFFSILRNSACIVALFLIFVNLSSCHKAAELLPQNPFKNPQDTNPPVFAGSHYNIIFILSDDVGYEIPTYSGGQSYSTPNLDFMAANGTQFPECHGNALCSPSRFMLATGKYNYRNYDHWGIMDTSQRTFANILRDAGYTTCVSGKWQFDGGDTSIHKFGFDKYMVNNAFNLHSDAEEQDSYYKDPQIYVNGDYLPASETVGKYGEDFFRQYVFDFIDSNVNKKPFFIYCVMHLFHLRLTILNSPPGIQRNQESMPIHFFFRRWLNIWIKKSASYLIKYVL